MVENRNQFHGVRLADQACSVTGPGGPLPLRLDLWSHSPTGFEWGYGGSGPAQLALAILAAVVGDDELAVRLHQRFKFEVIGHLHRNEWRMEVEYVREWVMLAMLRDMATENDAMPKGGVMEG